MKPFKKLLATVGIAALTFMAVPTAAYATNDGICLPSEAWSETVVTQEYVPAVPEVPAVYETVEHEAVPAETHTEYQRYSWTGGPVEGAPTSVPPGNDWQANTTNYEGAGHGTDPVGVAFDKSRGGSGNSDWFFWTAEEVTDVEGSDAWTEEVLISEAIPGVPAIEEVSHVVDHPAVVCDDPVIVPEKPDPMVDAVVGDSVVDCESGMVTKTTTVTTTDWVLDEENNVWIEAEPVVDITTESRDADAEECPVVVVPPVEPPVIVQTPVVTTPSVIPPVVTVAEYVDVPQPYTLASTGYEPPALWTLLGTIGVVGLGVTMLGISASARRQSRK